MDIDQEELNYQNSINSIFLCQNCKSVESNLSKNEISCSQCQTKYTFNQNVLDTLINPSDETISELTGMALENGFTKETYGDFKVRLLDTASGYESKLKKTENDHSNYYLQTQMNYEQAVSELEEYKDKKVLEIGSCYDYYFLKQFRDKGNDCYSLNIHFDLTNEQEYKNWPKKILGDMNHLPFQGDCFDLIIMSATSHHSVTPEKLFKEIYRVLRPGGKCLVINDPTWGVIKNLGGPDNTKAFRESHINENEYSIWHYNKMFRQSGFKYKHYFSSFYDEKLLNMNIDSRTRFYIVAKILKKLWSINLFRNLFKKYALWWGQAIFGFPMNVILTK